MKTKAKPIECPKNPSFNHEAFFRVIFMGDAPEETKTLDVWRGPLSEDVNNAILGEVLDLFVRLFNDNPDSFPSKSYVWRHMPRSGEMFFVDNDGNRFSSSSCHQY